MSVLGNTMWMCVLGNTMWMCVHACVRQCAILCEYDCDYLACGIFCVAASVPNKIRHVLSTLIIFNEDTLFSHAQVSRTENAALSLSCGYSANAALSLAHLSTNAALSLSGLCF